MPERADWPYRFALIPHEHLFVDVEYQRPLTSFVESVANEYDPALIGTLIVSERGKDKFAIIDGQTRHEGMARNAEPLMPCLVYMGLSRADEAKLFADLQTKRRGMATYLRFRAALVAKLPEALAIAKIATDAGFELDKVETPRTLKAISALESVYRRDPELLERVLATIAAAWPDADTEGRASGDMIRGLDVFYRREDRIDDRRLVERLAKIPPRTLRHRANALQEGAGSGTGGRAGYMADAILGVYARGGGKRGS